MKMFWIGMLLIIKSVGAYVPSPESLLRNNSNADIESSVISAQFEIVHSSNEQSAQENKLAFKKGEMQRMYYLNKGRIAKIYNTYGVY